MTRDQRSDDPNTSPPRKQGSQQAEGSPRMRVGLVCRDRRLRIVATAIIGVWLILAGRLVHLQWVSRDDFAARAARQRTLEQVIPARPGDIVDRSGRLLATTVRVNSLFVDPHNMGEVWPVARSIAEALDLDADRLFERIAARRDKRFVWIKRRLSDAESAAVRGLELPPSVWGFREELLRVYPQAELAAHVLGTRDIDGQGRGGLEQALDARLKGIDGTRRSVRDARGYVIDVLEEVATAPRHGETIVLSIDSVIQLQAERQLDEIMQQWQAKSASAVVLDPRNGELLAMASRPTFDPNRPAEADDDAWTNQTVAAVHEPGSTIKPLIVGWALDQQMLKTSEQIHCEWGKYRMGRRELHDHHAYGMLSVTDIVAKSSNIGMAKIGERLGHEQLHRAIGEFGFGRVTGVELPGEVAGLVQPLASWDNYSTGSIPMGHELAVTPLQMITAHAALANHGRMITPHLVIGDPTRRSQPRTLVITPVLQPTTADWLVTEAMRAVVERGTGKRAQLEGYEVFGKTGTAQKWDPQTGRMSRSKAVCSFVCGAPANDPRVLVLVTVDEPQSDEDVGGSNVAAPAATEILRRALIQQRVPSVDRLRTAKQ